MSSHNTLCEIEAEKLRRRGFTIEFEKKVMPHCVVDVIARRGDEIVIVECGYCIRSLEELKKVATKIIHAPYIKQWARYEPFRKASERIKKEIVEHSHNWREGLKPKPQRQPIKDDKLLTQIISEIKNR